MVVGVDEAGRGPLAGVVTACALHLVKKPPFNVKDSKALSSLQREKIFGWLAKEAHFCVGIADAAEIDKLNILRATFLAFERAINGLLNKSGRLKDAKFIIDGNLFRTKLKLDYVCIDKADQKIKEVSCASIVAKVVRDHLMQTAHFLYPEWNFAKHKGYPTQEHFSLIRKNKLTPLHRRSFSPCREVFKWFEI